jgi:hypothetical protein
MGLDRRLIFFISMFRDACWVGVVCRLLPFPYLATEADWHLHPFVFTSLTGTWGVQDKGIDEAFWPIFQMDKVEEGKGSHWSLRMLFAVIIGVGVYGSYTYAPDRGGLAAMSALAPAWLVVWFLLASHGTAVWGLALELQPWHSLASCRWRLLEGFYAENDLNVIKLATSPCSGHSDQAMSGPFELHTCVLKKKKSKARIWYDNIGYHGYAASAVAHVLCKMHPSLNEKLQPQTLGVPVLNP